jgi:hypothetical protein
MSTSTSTVASDFVRFHFHLITEHDIISGYCSTCWEEVVFMLSDMSTPAEVLSAPHECTAAWNCAQILGQELTDHPEKW